MSRRTNSTLSVSHALCVVSLVSAGIAGCGLERQGSSSSPERGDAVGEQAVPVRPRKVEYSTEPRRKYDRNWAVVVGIDEYPKDSGLSALKFAVNDVTLIADLLAAEFSYGGADPATKMPEGGIRRLLNENATRHEILKALRLEWLPEGVEPSPNDGVLFLFSGHGLKDEVGGAGYLAGVDAESADVAGTALRMSDVIAELRKLPCRHKAVILDCCFSGRIFKSAADAEPLENEAVVFHAKDGLDFYLRNSAFWGLAASQSDQSVPEVSDSGDHTIFATALHQELIDRANSRRDDHVFMFERLATRVTERVERKVFNELQVPRFGRLSGGVGDFVFVPSPKKRRMTPRDRAQRQAYAKDVLKGSLAWTDGHSGTAERILSGCAPELRHWEWNFLTRQAKVSVDVALRPSLSGGLTCASFSSSGQKIAFGRSDGKILLEETGSRGLERSPQTSIQFDAGSAITCLSFAHRDSTRLATGDSSGVLHVWEVTSSTPVFRYEGDGEPIRTVAFSQDGMRVAWGGDGGAIHVVDTRSGKEEAILPLEKRERLGTVRDLVFINAGDAARVAACIEEDVLFQLNEVQLWSLREKKKVCWEAGIEQQCSLFRPPAPPVSGIAVTPDGLRLAVAYADHSDEEPGSIMIWDIADGSLVSQRKAHSGPVADVIFSSDGERLFSVGAELKIWDAADLESIQEIMTLPIAGQRLEYAACANGGGWLAVADGEHVSILDGRTPAKLQTVFQFGFNAAFGADSSQVAVAGYDSTVKLFDVKTGRMLQVLVGHEEAVRCVDCNGDIVVSGSDDATVRIWNVRQPTKVQIVGQKERAGGRDFVTCVKISPQQRYVCFGNDDGMVEVCETEQDGRTVWRRRLHNGAVRDITFRPDGVEGFSVGNDGMIKQWCVKPNVTVTTFASVDKELSAIAVSPGGNTMGCGGVDGPITLWDVSSKRMMMSLHGHTDSIRDLEFSLDGGLLASASLDGTVCLWKIPQGEIRCKVDAHSPSVRSASFSPDGEKLVSVGTDGCFRIWDVHILIGESTAETTIPAATEE